MEYKLETLLSEGIIDIHKVTEVYADGVLVWKGLSEDLENIGKYFKFVKFNHSISEGFNRAEYKIDVELTEAFKLLDENSRMKKMYRANKILTSGDATTEEKNKAATKITTNLSGRTAATNFAQGLANRNADQYSSGIDALNDGRSAKNSVENKVTPNMMKNATDPKLANHIKQNDKVSGCVTENIDFASILKESGIESTNENVERLRNYLEEAIKLKEEA